MGTTWDPSGTDRTQVGPMLAPSTLLYGITRADLRWIALVSHQYDTISRFHFKFITNAYSIMCTYEMFRVFMCVTPSWNTSVGSKSTFISSKHTLFDWSLKCHIGPIFFDVTRMLGSVVFIAMRLSHKSLCRILLMIKAVHFYRRYFLGLCVISLHK